MNQNKNLPETNRNPVTVIKTGSRNQNTPLILGLIAAVGGAYLIKKTIDNAKQNQVSDGYDSGKVTVKETDPKTGKIINVTYNPSQIAAEFNQAFAGVGTDIDVIMSAADKSRNGRWSNISEAYRKMNNENLLSRLGKELSSGELAAFNSVLRNTAVHKYGSDEFLRLRSVSVRVINTKTNQWVTETFYTLKLTDNLILGKVDKRFTGKSGAAYYTFKNYPDLWFKESDLKRDYDSYDMALYIRGWKW
jgi:hypothetical protein